MRRLALVLAMFFPLGAQAAGWDVDMAGSTLGFTATQGGEAFHGTFPRFTPRIDFDEAAPEQGHIDVTVDLASVTVEGKDRQEGILGPEWFDTARIATAHFASRAITRVQGRNYRAEGTLTLKGITRPVVLDFTLSGEREVVATGQALLQRNAFAIGTGDYASADWIAYPVTVQFRVKAQPRQ